MGLFTTIVHSANQIKSLRLQHLPSLKELFLPLGAKSSTSPSVPLEIILQILDEVANNNDSHTLAIASLTCSTLKDYAQTLLFSSVKITTREAFYCFQDAVDPCTPRGSRLGAAVRHLSVAFDFNNPYHITEAQFAAMVRACPRLRAVSISVYGCNQPISAVPPPQQNYAKSRPAPAFSRQTIELLKSGPRVSSLEVSNWSDNGDLPSQLLEAWPTLQLLSLRGATPQIPSTEWSFNPQCTLEALELCHQRPPSTETMRWMLRGSADSLRSIMFKCEPSPGVLDEVVALCGSSLKRLSLPSFASVSPKHLSQCSNLKSLTIQNAQFDQRTLSQSHPLSLTNLAVGLDSV